MLRTSGQPRRHAIAAVELAVLLIPIVILLFGIWEVGRMVQCQQICVNAAREGVRLATLGFNVNTFGSYTYVYANTSTAPQTGSIPQYVETTVKNYLMGCGIGNVNNVTVQFQFYSGSVSNPSGLTPDTSRTDPWQGAKGDPFQLTVAVPYVNFRWTPVTWFNPGQIKAQVRWTMLMNDPFTVQNTVPGWTGVN